jgi:hypothetical protein
MLQETYILISRASVHHSASLLPSRPRQHNSRVRRDQIYIKRRHERAHKQDTELKIHRHNKHKNSSLKTRDRSHRVSTTIYTTQPTTRKHHGTPVTTYILVIRTNNCI